MIEFLPQESSVKDSVSLMKDLSSMAYAMLKNKGSESKAKFGAVFDFLNEFVKVHGKSIEQKALETTEKFESNVLGDIAVILTDLLLAAVDEFQDTASATSTTSHSGNKEQGQGQPPFEESKAMPGPKGGFVPCDEICGMFDLFRTCIEKCPSYFFQLPSAPGQEGREELLYRKSVETAINVLNKPDADTAQHAMDFLDALVSS